MHTLFAALPATLETERLALIAPEARDVEAIAHLANDPALAARLSRLPHPYTREDAQAFVAHQARNATDWSFAITRPPRVVIGMVGLHSAPGRRVELGYWLGAQHWGEGYASEAARALVQAVRATGILDGLRSRALVSNTASRRVLEKIGFGFEGTDIEQTGNLAGQTMARYSLAF